MSSDDENNEQSAVYRHYMNTSSPALFVIRSTGLNSRVLHEWAKKAGQQTFVRIKVLSVAHSAEICDKTACRWRFHHTQKASLHYLVESGQLYNELQSNFQYQNVDGPDWYLVTFKLSLICTAKEFWKSVNISWIYECVKVRDLITFSGPLSKRWSKS